jgi:phosphoglucosamine mutase
MNRRYFGTDGIRGLSGGAVVNQEFFARLGCAAGRWAGGTGVVLIGRDTRSSGEGLAQAVAGGFRTAGLAPRILGVLPTPALARATRVSGAALGAVVTASHNPAADNGIKFFRTDGRKLTDGEESRIEDLIEEQKGSGREFCTTVQNSWPDPFKPDFVDDYIAEASRLLPAGSLRGWRIVLDTANGATCATSPAVLRRLGAELIPMGDAPDGANINEGVGTEHAAGLAASVRANGARLGIAHDGDGDRCILCDEKGGILDGDEILTMLAVRALARGELAAGKLVVTVQSNLGVDAAVRAAGGQVVRTPVGDRYVAERMAAEGATLGGESSGHVIFSDISASGDGLIAALKVIEVMLSGGRPLSELRRALRKFPQATESVGVRRMRPISEMPELRSAIAALEAELGGRGRVLVRYSGTEPKLRLLVEGPTDDIALAGLARLRAAVEKEAR